MTPKVSICIPAYRCEPFIAATLDSALSQSEKDIEILVSNDGGHASPALERYAEHPKISVSDAPALGWVENTNRALSMARGQYFMVLPHDDLLEPDYVAACLAVLEAEPESFAVCTDIAGERGVIQATEVRGDLASRVAQVMGRRFNAFSYRAVMRRNPAHWAALKLRPNPPDDYAVDTIWMLQQVLFGEVRRVPRPLYRKVTRKVSARTVWHQMDDAQLLAAWSGHCEVMGAIAAAHLDDPRRVAALVRRRIWGLRVDEAPHEIKRLNYPHIRLARWWRGRQRLP